ncbi:tetratricopeptide repeat protein [Rubrolithibacter danxiaensis]|uniref:tetratricopeptide repeat protein n=1 Tax=Rubrolithibacter danxiaensis TaxID=3390805 RepID=UPI003BF8F682
MDLLGKKPTALNSNEVGGTEHYIDEVTAPGNTALILSELGKVYEFSGDLKQAIGYYEKAIKVQQQCNDETNLLSSYHHLGFCLIHTGKIDEGLKLLLLTVEGFHRNRQYEYLGNSLSEIGHVVYERPELLNNPLLNEERIEVALENVSEQLTDIYTRLISAMNAEQAVAAMPNPLKGKLLYLTMLISCTPFRDLLWRSMGQLYQLLKVDSSNKDYLLLIIGLGYITGGVDEWREGAEAERIIEQLCFHCIMLNGGRDINGKTKVFQWFAFWMNTVGLRQGITPEEMWIDALRITDMTELMKKYRN